MAETVSDAIGPIMEAASEALAGMDYLTCEDRCLEAMAIARAGGDWSYYGRILLPLLEARRQRRMIAADGVIRLGSDDLQGDPDLWLERANPGCIVLTGPHDDQTARQLVCIVSKQRLYVEVLVADHQTTAKQWTVRTFGHGPKVSCAVPAPPAQWINRWLGSKQRVDIQGQAQRVGQTADLPGFGPADWFLDAWESLGDAALAQVKMPLGDPQRVEFLEQCLQVVPDHEKLHQALVEAAGALTHAGTGK